MYFAPFSVEIEIASSETVRVDVSATFLSVTKSVAAKKPCSRLSMPRPAASSWFLLRVPAPVHQALALKARAAGKSLNAYCAEKLATL